MSLLHTTVSYRAGLLRLFRSLGGRTLVGAVDGRDCVELVFDDSDDIGGNLVSIFTDGRRRGQVAFGFVCQELIEGGYGKAPEE